MTEIGSHKKTNMYDSIYHLYKVPQVVTFTEPESPWWVPGADGGREKRSLLFEWVQSFCFAS